MGFGDDEAGFSKEIASTLILFGYILLNDPASRSVGKSIWASGMKFVGASSRVEDWANLDIGTGALRECRVEKLEEGIDRWATCGCRIGPEEGCRESRFGNGKFRGRHGERAALGGGVYSVVMVRERTRTTRRCGVEG